MGPRRERTAEPKDQRTEGPNSKEQTMPLLVLGSLILRFLATCGIAAWSQKRQVGFGAATYRPSLARALGSYGRMNCAAKKLAKGSSPIEKCGWRRAKRRSARFGQANDYGAKAGRDASQA